MDWARKNASILALAAVVGGAWVSTKADIAELKARIEAEERTRIEMLDAQMETLNRIESYLLERGKEK